jgi:hypothetical protein
MKLKLATNLSAFDFVLRRSKVSRGVYKHRRVTGEDIVRNSALHKGQLPGAVPLAVVYHTGHGLSFVIYACTKKRTDTLDNR